MGQRLLTRLLQNKSFLVVQISAGPPDNNGDHIESTLSRSLSLFRTILSAVRLCPLCLQRLLVSSAEGEREREQEWKRDRERQRERKTEKGRKKNQKE